MSWTELHSAAGEGDLESIRRLVKDKADINAKDNAGLVPLHVAAGDGEVEAVKLLCELGADVNAQTSFDGSTPMHKAVEEGYTEVIEALIEGGADVNAGNNEGFTPLHECARAGMAEAVTLLLEKGANLNGLSKNRSTPLHLAIMYEHLAVTSVLGAAGADVNLEDDDGMSSSDLSTSEEAMRALGTWKPIIILEGVQGFILRLLDRITKEAGVPLTTPEAALSHGRFNNLFNHKEFLTYIERFQYKDKRLKEITKNDTLNHNWSCKFLGSFFNGADIFEPPSLRTNQVARHFITLVMNKEFKKAPVEDDDD